MAITLTSRKAARKQLAALLAEIPALVAAYDHQTKALGGRSPVAMVHSDGTRGQYMGYADERHRFVVTILWRRDDAAATEDYVDDLEAAIRQKLLDSSAVAGVWNGLEIDEEFSSLDYPIIENVQYRRTWLRVTAQVISAS